MTTALDPAALNRFEYQAGQESSTARTRLAMLQPAAVQGTVPAPVPDGAAAQSAHPSMQRIASPAWQGFTGQMNRAQAAQDDADVWVTVPVDKVSVSPGGGHAVHPVYASTKGYQPRPGESAGSIPPPQTQAVQR